MKRRTIKNRFSELLAIKERREGRSISKQEVADTIGASFNTIQALAINRGNKYLHRETIEKLLEYFDVSHHEFFETVISETEEGEDTVTPQVA